MSEDEPSFEEYLEIRIRESFRRMHVATFGICPDDCPWCAASAQKKEE